jgi:hypothetical protein
VSGDLTDVRSELAERRWRAALVRDRCAVADARLRPGDRVITIRCDHCPSLLAKVYVEAAIFVSRIEWLPSDELTLHPWARDSYLAEERLQHLSDAALADHLEMLDRWSRGLPANGSRWLSRTGPWEVRDVLTEPSGPSSWLPDLWTRCRRHPGQAAVADRQELLAATRARLPARRPGRR